MDKKYSRLLVSLVMSLVVLGGIFYAGFYFGKKQIPEIVKVDSLNNKTNEISDKTDFSPFWKAWNLLKEKHVSTGTSTKDINDQDKVWGAIEGLASSYGDPYTVFFPPVQSSAFEEDIRGNFEGVGMEIGTRNGILTVISPLKGTPAYNAGVLSGDKIIKINDTPSSGMNSDEAIKLIRGKKGTSVTLLLMRNGVKDPIEKKIVRDVINIPTIDTELLPQNIFVIKLYNFSANSPEDFRNALREFAKSKTNKLILDLRGNPGGYLEAAISMASWFLPVGKVVVKENFGDKQKEQVYRSKGYNIFEDFNLKMVILVNDGSASASEILAGALQENGVAKLVGVNTFGKGTVQELIKLTSDTSIKITVARWLTPNGVSISEGGLKPDFEIKMTPSDVEKNKDPQMDKAVEILNTK